MKAIETIRTEGGFALVLTLVIMAAMTAIGIAALTTSTTDMLIARNEREGRTAFFLAESGIEEAVARLELPETHADPSRFVGESQNGSPSERDQRIAGGVAPFAADDFDSAELEGDLPMDLGDYAVELAYTFESGETWCDGDGCNGEIVTFCLDFGFTRGAFPTNCEQAPPVYMIDSLGTTFAGTEARIRAFVTSSSLNVVPPGGVILFAEGSIDMGGAGDVNGPVGSTEGDDDGINPDCGTAAVPDCVPASGWIGAWPTPGTTGMNDYIGMPVADLREYAEFPSPYDQAGPAAFPYDNSDWGDMCDDTLSMVIADHICENESKLIYIDNAGAGAARVLGGGGRGILLVTGDLDLGGNFMWEGLIYVMGQLDIVGDVTVYGAIMVDGDDIVGNNALNGATGGDDVDIQGALAVVGDIDVAASVGGSIGVPKMLRWSRR